jgi:hypothetical protein
LIKTHASANSPALDLFLADAADDEAIRAWARAQGVSRDEVRAGRITLNHTRGALAIPSTLSPIMPRLMQRLGEQWVPMSSGR